MAKMENVTVYICDFCGKIEAPKCIGCNSEETDDLPVGWTRLYEKITMCPTCTIPYWYGAASIDVSLTNADNKESV